MKNIFRNKQLLLLIAALVVLYSCANRGQGPQGGPKDKTPPKVVKSIPADKSTNVSKNQVEIDFDESINLKDISKNVIISPPQRINPDIKAYGKKLTIQFADTLIPNTTYSVNFGEAIEDMTEGNKLKNYVFSFSTGSEIDTLQIAGNVLDASNLNPVQGITVGIYNDLNDSAFLTKPFMRITRTDENGRFVVPNVKNGKYRVYALNDVNRDNIYQRGEGMAFDENVYQTNFEFVTKPDTVWKDSVTVDSIRSIKVTRFMPDDIILKYFKSDSKNQYLVKSERSEANKISFYFNTNAEKLPEVRPLNVNWDGKVLLQKNEGLDSLTYWLTDSTLIQKDTILLQIKYLRTDSLFKLQPKTDTIHFALRKIGKKVGTASKKRETLAVQTNISSSFDVYNPLRFTFNVPIKQFDASKIHLKRLVDSVYVPIPFNLQKKDSIGMNFSIAQNWVPESKYKLNIDSAAFISIYNAHNDSLKSEFTVKSLEDYSSIKLILPDYDSTAVFQVVNKEDKVIRSVPINKNGTKVEYLEPGDYYIRMFLDRNRNGLWTTGDFSKKLQPEEVFYNPKKMTMIKNWEFEETWDYKSIPLLKQKPVDLKKSAANKHE